MPFDSRSRQLTDPRDLRALSHPLRQRLLELLEERPLTATEAATALGTTPANCSFHLRLLARHGFVAEAPGGTGRQRPWQLADREFSVVGRDLDAEGRLAVRTMQAVLDERQRQRVETWRRAKYDYPAEWQTASTESYFVAHLTAAELTEVVAACRRALRPYLHREGAERPAGSVPVDFYLAALPRRRPGEGS
jgi:predicted ArsR family transcriptional regulator